MGGWLLPSFVCVVDACVCCAFDDQQKEYLYCLLDVVVLGEYTQLPTTRLRHDGWGATVGGCAWMRASPGLCTHTDRDRAQGNDLAVCQGEPTTSSLQLQWHPARVLPHQKPLRWWTQSDNNHRIESWQQMTGLTPSSDTTRDQTQPNMSNFRCSQCTGRYQSHTGYGRCQCSTRVVYHRDASLPPTPPPTHSPPT